MNELATEMHSTTAAGRAGGDVCRDRVAGPPVVGIGTSAGGLQALKTLLAAVPADSGFAWVVVVHLSPEHESRLPELLQSHVELPVQQVTETVALEPDRIYVIPPGANLETVDSHLRLDDLEAAPGDRAPIDHFFRALADTHDGSAVAVVLTGTGSDGTRGLQAVKERGGLAVVQDPGEAEHDGMPRSALTTGLVDLVLPLDRIGPEIVAYARTRPNVTVEVEEGPAGGRDAGVGPDRRGDSSARDHTGAPEAATRDCPGPGEAATRDRPGSTGAPSTRDRLLDRILAQVRAGTGRDFSRYRRTTVLRRVSRRMQLCHVEELDAYLAVLREDPGEVEALRDDLLIAVTRFFRDPELFEALAREVIPALFEDVGEGGGIRVWSVGCATGEEPYSLAMLLLEEAERRDLAAPRIQVFATDLHEPSLARAREGLYPAEIETEVGDERLRRFFREDSGGYRVRPEVRERVVFARHDVLSDPPYSRLDLVSCRNVLVYLEPDLQRDVVALFHFTLRPGGFLALTRSERQDRGELFEPLDAEPALYRRNDAGRSDAMPPLARTGLRKPLEEGPAYRPPPAPGVLHQRMVERYAPPSLLVSPSDRVLHVSENAGRYLLHAGGEPSARVERLVRPELRVELRAALRQARERGEPRSTPPISVSLAAGVRPVVVHVRPAPAGEEEGMALVLFEERVAAVLASGADAEADGEAGAGAARVRRLEAELERARTELVLLRDEHDRTEEELRTANEELESSNEELRSTLEELETRGEELTSLNEELRSLSQENQYRAEEMETLSRDLQRLLVATEIGTMFLDTELRIVRYTPRIGHLFHARRSDIGRPLQDLKSRLRYDSLMEDARSVLARGQLVEREVEDDDGRAYLARLLPHWGPRGELDGVVAVFIDITPRKRMEEAEEESRIKSQFLSTMSHELRTPLTAVIGVADLMETEVLGELNEKQKQNMQRIKQSAWHLVRIIDEVLSFSRSKAGKERVKEEGVDLAKVARDVVGMIRTAADRGGVELALDAPAPVQIRTDGGKVTQIATNLVGNAVKFARSLVTVEVEETEAVEHRVEPGVELRVRDDGPGIPADRVEEIFEPFTQLDSSSTREQGGTGLGLTIARRQARLLGGDLSVQTAEGEGSTFTLWLPRELPRPEREAG